MDPALVDLNAKMFRHKSGLTCEKLRSGNYYDWRNDIERILMLAGGGGFGFFGREGGISIFGSGLFLN